MVKFPYIDGIHEDHEMGRLEHLHAKPNKEVPHGRFNQKHR